MLRTKFWFGATRRSDDVISRDGGFPATGTILTLALPDAALGTREIVTVQVMDELIAGMSRSLPDEGIVDKSRAVHVQKNTSCGCSLDP